MVNKGLEVMEAKWLFEVAPEQIQVVVHPQSVIHSMVEYEDGAVLAQLGTPDMRLPIQYALYYPNRRNLSGKRLDFYQLSSLTFEEPDLETFFGLKLAFRAMELKRPPPEPEPIPLFSFPGKARRKQSAESSESGFPVPREETEKLHCAHCPQAEWTPASLLPEA